MITAVAALLPLAARGADVLTPSPAAPAPAPAGAALPLGIVIRTTENVTGGGWLYVLNQCKALGISRVDVLVKQDEDNFHSVRTGQTLQSGELLVALPGEKTAAGWENSDWLKEMLARAKEMKIDVWAWFPCFHDSRLAEQFPRATYQSVRGEKFADAANPEAQTRLETLLAKILGTYAFDGVSLDWLRYNSWEDGSRGPLGDAFARRYQFTWEPGALANDYTKARWYEARATAIADWVGRTTRSMRERHPGVRWGAFLLPPQFSEVSQNYPLLGRAGLDFLQPMGYWIDFKQPPQWVGEGIVSPYARAPQNGTSFWPTLGIDGPPAETAAALRSLPTDPLGGMSWFTYGTWEQHSFDKLRDMLKSPDGARLFASAAPADAPAASPPTPLTSIPALKSVQPKDFPADASVWSVVCLGELYRRGALAERNNDPVCPVLAFHTFAEGPLGSNPYLYKCSTTYLDGLLKAIAAAGFQVTPLSRLQSFLITGDVAMLPPRPLVLTLDDGSESVYKLFAPRAAKYRFPYTLALITGWLSETDQSDHASPEPLKPDPSMTWGEAKELYATGLVEVMSHSDGLHYMATDLPGSDESVPAETIRQFLTERNRVETEAEYERRVRLDMITSRRKLAEHGFRVPSIFCWPYGEWTQNAKAIGRQTGFTHFLGFDTPPIFISRDVAAEADLPRVPVLRWDEGVPLTFPADHAEGQAWWLAFLKVARQSQSRTLLAAALAQLAPENAGHPQAEITRAALEMLNGAVDIGTERLLRLRRAVPFDSAATAAIDQTLTLYTPGPKPR